MKTHYGLIIATFAAAFSLSSVGVAQESGMQQEQPAPIEVSDQQLNQFADAQAELSGIQQEFAGRLQQVEDPEEAHALQVEANEEMTSAVEDAGLDVESFNAIARAIQTNPELQQRLTAMMQDTSQR